MIFLQIFLVFTNIVGPTCSGGQFFFETSLMCGNCPSNSLYSSLLKRCACPKSSSESATGSLTCTSCNGGGQSVPGQTQCFTNRVGTLDPSSADNTNPCLAGSDVLILNNQLICAPVGYVNYNNVTVEDKLIANPCQGTTTWSIAYSICYSIIATNLTDPDEADVNEAFQVCSSGRSSKACLALKNWCVINKKYCDHYEALLQQLRPDVISPFNISLNNEMKQIRGYNFYLQISNRFGDIIYNGPFSESHFSLCAYTKSIGTNEFYEMSLNNVSDNQPTRQNQFGFAQRLRAEDLPFQRGIRNQVLTQPFINNLASGYYEYCNLGVNQLIYAFQNQTLFFQMYVNNQETIHTPVIELAKDVPSKIRPADYVNYNGTSSFYLAHYNETTQKVRFAERVYIDFSMNTSFRYSPIIRVKYNELKRQQFSFPQVSDQSPLTQYLPRLFPVTSKDKVAFDLEVRNYSALKVSLPLTGIMALVIVTFCGLIIGLVQNCRGSGTGGISFNAIRKPKLIRNKENQIEEQTKSSVSHILDIFWYLFTYAGVGLNLYIAIYQIQLIFVREETIMAGIPDNLNLINGIGFVMQLIGYINAKADDASKQCLFVQAYRPDASEMDIAESTKNYGWKIATACNRLLTLQKMHLGELELTSVTFMILQVAFDFFYQASPSIIVDSVFSIDKTYLGLTTAGIYSIIYLIIVLLKLFIYLFSHSPFSSFQEFLQSIGLSLFIFDTPRSCVYIHGGVNATDNDDVQQDTMIGYCQQTFITEAIGRQIAQSQAQVLRIFATNSENDPVYNLSNEIDKQDQMVSLIKQQKISEKKVYGIQKYPPEIVENYQSVVNSAAVVQTTLNTLGKVEDIGFPPYLLYDIPRGMSETEPRYFKYEKQFTDQSWFYRNPKYRNQFWIDEWIQEMSFLNSAIMFLSTWLYNQYIVIIIITAFIVFLDLICNKIFANSLSRVNLVQPNFLGYF